MQRVFFIRWYNYPMARGFAPSPLIAGLWPARGRANRTFWRCRSGAAGQRPANSRHGAEPRAIRGNVVERLVIMSDDTISAEDAKAFAGKKN